jgi:hypothetical protein
MSSSLEGGAKCPKTGHPMTKFRAYNFVFKKPTNIPRNIFYAGSIFNKAL